MTKLTSSTRYLTAIPAEDLKMFLEKFPYLTEKIILDQADYAFNWLLARGRKYKNYKAFFNNWLWKTNGWKKEEFDKLTPNQKIIRKMFGK